MSMMKSVNLGVCVIVSEDVDEQDVLSELLDLINYDPSGRLSGAVAFIESVNLDVEEA